MYLHPARPTSVESENRAAPAAFPLFTTRCLRALGLLVAALTLGTTRVPAAPTRLVDEAPVKITRLSAEVVLVDFGRVAFGNLRITGPAGATQEIAVHFGEAFREGRILRQPPGTVRYARASATLTGAQPLVVAPAADKRNTTPPAVLTPPAWGVVLPFRWVEIENWPGELQPAQIRRQAAFASTWQDDAASFQSSNEMLNRIWELCRYSIKATTFLGVYVDGDRERIAYEADAYLNQLSHYATDPDPQMARDTFDHLMKFPTWPTEWSHHMIFMAHADWWQTGDRAWLGERYESLKPKLLLSRARPDGLLTSDAAQIKKGDLIDWPPAERDGFVLTPVNSVVNAFHVRSLTLMAELARALGKNEEASSYESLARSAGVAFQKTFFDRTRGVYRDGEATEHASIHSNLFPLAFGLVPAADRASVLAYVKGKGMACSVYAAQYLMDALFEHGAEATALALMLAPGDRSWRHMVESGTTITWEAWDQKYKPNQDWNHAWGAAPGNLLPRYVLGVRSLRPGWKTVLFRPQPAALTACEGKVPTPQGPITAAWTSGSEFKFRFSLPREIAVRLELPVTGQGTLLIDGRTVSAARVGDRIVYDGVWSGSHEAVVR